MSASLDTIKEWLDSLRHDIEVVKAVVESDQVPREARKFAAVSLSYLVTRLDLIPDWNETIGVMDDAMVVRICLDLASAYQVGESLGDDMRARVGRLILDVDLIKEVLGDDLYPRFRKHCARLVQTPVRGRTPDSIVDDESTRQELYEEIAGDLLRIPAATFTDRADIEVRFKSYLHHKLS